jgi:hypothetical protein
VRKHGCQLFTADSVTVATVIVGLTQRREFTNRFQEVAVGVRLRAQREEIFPVAGFHDPFHAFDVLRVRRTTRFNQFNPALSSVLMVSLRHPSAGSWSVLSLFRQIAGVHGVWFTGGRLQRGSLRHKRCYACAGNENTQ